MDGCLTSSVEISAIFIQGFSHDFETISHYCGTHFFFLIMNKQEYNELNLIISYVALLVSNGD